MHREPGSHVGKDPGRFRCLLSDKVWWSSEESREIWGVVSGPGALMQAALVAKAYLELNRRARRSGCGGSSIEHIVNVCIVASHRYSSFTTSLPI
jgi:hypothetical protein